MGMAMLVVMVGVLDSLFFRPLSGVADQNRLVGIGPWVGARTSYPDYLDLERDGSTAFESVAAFALFDYTVGIRSAVLPARGMLATHTLMPLLRMRPRLGRWFTAAEDRAGASPVVLISEKMWRDHFGSSEVLGSRIRIAGRAFAIVGILPDGATAPDLAPIDIVLPLSNAPWFGGPKALTSRDYQWIRIIGRLRSSVSAAEATALATTIYRRSNLDVQSVDQSTLGRTVVPVRELRFARRDPHAPSAQVSIWLTVLGGVVMVIIWANVVSLVLARGVREQRDLAIHVALGAARHRLIGRIVLEITILVTIATISGLILARWANASLVSRLLGGSVASPPIDVRMSVFAVGVAVLCILVCGIAPAARVVQTPLRSSLTSGTSSVTRVRRQMLRLLVTVEIALGVLLLAEALVFTASLRNATRVDLGIDVQHLLIADVDLEAAGLTRAAATAATQRILDAMTIIPGVRVAGMTNAAALPGFLTYPVSAPGRDASVASPNEEVPSVSAVTSGYLEALGVSLKAGRGFNTADAVSNRSVVLTSERLSRFYWPTRSPLGQCVKFDEKADAQCAEVIGVVADRRASPLDARGSLEIYVPLGSAALPPELAESFPGRELAVRVAGDPERSIAQLRAALLTAVPELPAVRVRDGDEYLERQFRSWRLGTTVLGVFSVVAAALVAMGVFGVASHLVAQRLPEMGVRMALGARSLDVMLLVLFESLVVGVIGCAIGSTASLLALHLTEALAFGVSPSDPRTIIGADLILISITALATLLPAIRAGHVDPVSALKSA